MSPLRVVGLFVFLPLLLCLERASYYAMRSVLVLAMTDAGAPIAAIRPLFTVMQLVSMVALIVAGVAGILLRPIWLIVAGSLIATVGYFVLAAAGASAAPLYTGTVLISGGVGLAKPALYALAALELGHPREQLRAALFVLLYGMVNVGAFLGPMLAGLGRTVPFFHPSAGIQVLAFGVGLVLVTVSWVTRNQVAAPAPDAPRSSRVVLGGALVALVLVPFLVQSTLTLQTQDDVLRRAGVPMSSLAMLMGLNPVVVTFTCGALFVVSLILHFMDKRLPVLYATAAGLCIIALASSPFVLFASTAGSSTVMLLSTVGVGALAVAEAFVTPYALSRILGDVSPRFVTAVSAGWFLVSLLVGTAVGPIAAAVPTLVPYIVAASALFCLALGVGGFFAIRPLYRELFGPTLPVDERK